MSMPPYADRLTMFGLSSEDIVKAALADPESYVLDVRSEDEIGDEKVDHPNYRQATCTADSCPGLEGKDLSEIAPNKDAKLVIYCRSGKRANKAKEYFEKNGYTNIINAGGYDDIVNFK